MKAVPEICSDDLGATWEFGDSINWRGRWAMLQKMAPLGVRDRDAWNHCCQLACPISESTINMIMARPDLAVRRWRLECVKPLHAHFVWQYHVMLEIRHENDRFSLVAHATNADDAAEAIGCFSSVMHDKRPQAISWNPSLGESHCGMSFAPMATTRQPCESEEELRLRYGEEAAQWLWRFNVIPPAARVVFISSENDSGPIHFIHELSHHLCRTHEVIVYHGDAHALVIGGTVHYGIQRLKIIQHAAMRNAIVVIDDIAGLLLELGHKRLGLLKFMAALVQDAQGHEQLPLVIGLLPNSNSASVVKLLPPRWHPYLWFHLSDGPCTGESEIQNPHS